LAETPLDPSTTQTILYKHAIAQCKDAGIKVKMITGDHAATARAIGDQLGLQGAVLTGVELQAMDDEACSDERRAQPRCSPARVSNTSCA
jgi:magnesium-transporting ATPase (P-type)